ncbi:signal peptide peptidase SppA [Zavarzinia compransoris]|uniref:Signal peptide peptidase SppA n=1 Tax=Zavarzinia compransoris TaxID=1264899 RepID=A0A317DY19_9PROT|nr:signal peptide peptidase SppA [Zavarzinia compransoris]PWR17735.1 signal peptide peptidase SppA [Zavarzinia compransoris]TDP49258.1 signal peptide peptidase A [Zavarzinia compransoris]
MNGSDDLLQDRRLLRRRLTRWRLLAAVFAVALGTVMLPGLLGGSLRPHVARVAVEGLIIADDERLALLERLGEDPLVEAVILAIDSPGGTTVGGEALYDSLRRLAAKKPVVASIGTLGTSAAYLIATAADRIYAYDTSITGSIGVLIQSPEFSKLMAEIGISVNEVKSAPLKASPSPFEEMAPDARAALQAVIDDSFHWFRDIVGERRALAPEALAKVTDGRIFTGRQALELKLVDALGAETEIMAWLAAEKGIDPDLPIVKVAPENGGFDAVLSGKAFVPKWLTLDGLTSVWHPRLD